MWEEVGEVQIDSIMGLLGISEATLRARSFLKPPLPISNLDAHTTE